MRSVGEQRAAGASHLFIIEHTAAQQANPDKQQCCRYGDKHSQQNIQAGGKPKKQGSDKTDQNLCHCMGISGSVYPAINHLTP